MSDSRVDILSAHYVKENSHPQYASNEDDIAEARHEAEWTIADLEAAGLIVIDPDDEDTLKRVRVAIFDPGEYTPRADNYEEPTWRWQARAVIVVLRDAR